jgi:iron-only hydrogenase group A
MSEATVKLSIDSREVEVKAGTSLLEACARAGARVPTLCYLEGLAPSASCGLCVVEVEGAKSLSRACATTAAAGMKVSTSSGRVMRARRVALELLLANHPADCLSCARNGSCELQSAAELMGIRERRFPRTRASLGLDESAEGLVRDNDKCILCGRCVAVCQEVQGVSAISFAGRGGRTHVATFLDRGLARSACVQCGQCSLVCPTGAITERDDTRAVWAELRDASRTAIVQAAPAIRASLGEALGMAPGSLVTGKMAAALRRIGFSKVFDTQFAADLTIMEEGSELLERISRGGVLPMITSCSPGWINYIEGFYPELAPHLSSCKSPQQMFGAVAKSFYAEQAGLDPERMSVVSIMPCTAKKRETRRAEMRSAWEWWQRKGRASPPFFDVDWALTTRELARMIREAGIDIESLPEEGFDDPLGRSTGAATIFAATGGVMEAALRTVYEVVEQKPLERLDFKELRGLEGIKEAVVSLGGKEIKVAAAHTLKNAHILLEGIRAGTSPYAFIEIMSCPGGCVGGGGQPILPSDSKRLARGDAVYREDRRLELRKSHDNPSVKELYASFLGKPLGELSHELLHTSYSRREF